MILLLGVSEVLIYGLCVRLVLMVFLVSRFVLIIIDGLEVLV